MYNNCTYYVQYVGTCRFWLLALCFVVLTVPSLRICSHFPGMVDLLEPQQFECPVHRGKYVYINIYIHIMSSSITVVGARAWNSLPMAIRGPLQTILCISILWGRSGDLLIITTCLTYFFFFSLSHEQLSSRFEYRDSRYISQKQNFFVAPISVFQVHFFNFVILLVFIYFSLFVNSVKFSKL